MNLDNNMNMFMNNNMNMPMNNNMNMFMNNMIMNMPMNMPMNNNMNMPMNNYNIYKNLDNQNTFFEYVYDRFIINDKDNDNNIEKTFIYNNFLNFIDYLKINDVILYSKFLNLKNQLIFNVNLNNYISNLNVKYDEDKNIDFIFQTNDGKIIHLFTPLDLTFSQLIYKFKIKIGVGPNFNFIFIYNGTKLNIEDNRPVKDIFKLKSNKVNILITVFDEALVLGA